MEKTILNTTLTLDTAPLHVAPGGSTLCTLKGDAAAIAKLLMALREEMAYGMADVRTLSAQDKVVETDIYFGKADETDFHAVYQNHAEDIALVGLKELSEGLGMSMRARNQVIDALKV